MLFPPRSIVCYLILWMMALTLHSSGAAPVRRRKPNALSAAAAAVLSQRQQQPQANGRWLQPCAGSTPVEYAPPPEPDDVASSPVSGIETWNTLSKRTLPALARRIDALVNFIDNLKKHYADHRFKDTVIALDQVGFQLEGMPKLPPRRRSSRVTMETYRDIVNQAVSDLTAIGPFLETSLEGEKQLDHIHHYISKYEQLLDDQRYGFYTILCELTQIRTLLNSVVTSDSSSTSSSSYASRPRLNNVQTSTNVDNASPPVVVQAATDVLVVNHAIRHYRDYVILRDLRKLLHRLRTDIKQSTR